MYNIKLLIKVSHLGTTPGVVRCQNESSMDFLRRFFGAILNFLLVAILFSLGFGQVGLDVEVSKEKHEDDGLDEEVVGDDSRELALEGYQTQGVDEDQHELDLRDRAG